MQTQWRNNFLVRNLFPEFINIPLLLPFCTAFFKCVRCDIYKTLAKGAFTEPLVFVNTFIRSAAKSCTLEVDIRFHSVYRPNSKAMSFEGQFGTYTLTDERAHPPLVKACACFRYGMVCKAPNVLSSTLAKGLTQNSHFFSRLCIGRFKYTGPLKISHVINSIAITFWICDCMCTWRSIKIAAKIANSTTSPTQLSPLQVCP